MSPTSALSSAPPLVPSSSAQSDSSSKSSFRWLSKSKTNAKAGLAALGGRSKSDAGSANSATVPLSREQSRDKDKADKSRERDKESLGVSLVKKVIVGAVVDDWLVACRFGCVDPSRALMRTPSAGHSTRASRKTTK